MSDSLATDDRVVVQNYDRDGSYGIDGREGTVINPVYVDDRPFSNQVLVEVALDGDPLELGLESWLFKPEELVKA